ncbi:histidine kinase [Myxacorys almedinensis]|uniref:histidine kinase n=1 Tax=Myxacorys almedinensis TaxID=2651157 RepID=UPI00192E7F33|nr:histidine kinase [Myxacorys almedinensis]
MANLVKDRISSDLKQVKEVGQLRRDRIRDIIQGAISQVMLEVKGGTGEVRSLVKDAFSSAVESIQENGSQVKEEVAASVEGVVEGISRARHKRIAETEAEVNRLQAQLDEQEGELERDVEEGLAGLKEAGNDLSADLREQIEAAIAAIRDSEEASVLKRQYAQLQAQAAILRANLAARGDDYHTRAQAYLDDAKRWYDQTRPQAEVMKTKADQKAIEFDAKLGEAGTALARREKQVRQLLRDLLKQASEALRDDQPQENRPVAGELPSSQPTSSSDRVERSDRAHDKTS